MAAPFGVGNCLFYNHLQKRTYNDVHTRLCFARISQDKNNPAPRMFSLCFLKLRVYKHNNMVYSYQTIMRIRATFALQLKVLDQARLNLL